MLLIIWCLRAQDVIERELKPRAQSQVRSERFAPSAEEQSPSTERNAQNVARGQELKGDEKIPMLSDQRGGV